VGPPRPGPEDPPQLVLKKKKKKEKEEKKKKKKKKKEKKKEKKKSKETNIFKTSHTCSSALASSMPTTSLKDLSELSAV